MFAFTPIPGRPKAVRRRTQRLAAIGAALALAGGALLRAQTGSPLLVLQTAASGPVQNSIGFGSVSTGSSVNHTITLSNGGGGTLTFSSMNHQRRQRRRLLDCRQLVHRRRPRPVARSAPLRSASGPAPPAPAAAPQHRRQRAWQPAPGSAQRLRRDRRRAAEDGRPDRSPHRLSRRPMPIRTAWRSAPCIDDASMCLTPIPDLTKSPVRHGQSGDHQLQRRVLLLRRRGDVPAPARQVAGAPRPRGRVQHVRH